MKAQDLARPINARDRVTLAGVVRAFRLARALRRQRRHLRDLDTHLLDDIGISREQAEREAARPVWDVPEYWRMRW